MEQTKLTRTKYQKKYPEEFYQEGSIHKYQNEDGLKTFAICPRFRDECYLNKEGIEYLTEEDYKEFDKRLNEAIEYITETALMEFLLKLFPKYFDGFKLKRKERTN